MNLRCMALGMMISFTSGAFAKDLIYVVTSGKFPGVVERTLAEAGFDVATKSSGKSGYFVQVDQADPDDIPRGSDGTPFGSWTHLFITGYMCVIKGQEVPIYGNYNQNHLRGYGRVVLNAKPDIQKALVEGTQNAIKQIKDARVQEARQHCELLSRKK